MTNLFSFEAQNICYEFEWDFAKAASNLRKHGLDFNTAASVFMDTMAQTEYDAEHSFDEERWITIGHERDGLVLVVSHTCQTVDAVTIRIRIISARHAIKRERQAFYEHCQMHSPWQVQQQPSIYGVKMIKTIQASDDDDDTPREFDFSKAVRGKFYRPNLVYKMPGSPGPMTMTELIDLAASKNVKLSGLFREWAEQAQKAAETSAT
jgi:uncharacterized protein